MGKKLKPYSISALEIVDTMADGKSVGKKDEKVIFVEKAVPGDIVDVHVYKKQKKVPVARIERMITPSPHRVEPVCRHFGNCGGCKWQNISYAQQLFFKQKQVVDAIQRIAKVKVDEVRPILGVAEPYHYRNKVEFTFSSKRWVPPEVLAKGEKIDWSGALGYHVARFFDKVIDIHACYLHRPVINDIRNAIRDFSKEQDYSYYNIRDHVGYLRNVLFRTSDGSGELMVILIVGEDDPGPAEQLFQHLESRFPEITSYIWMYNHKLNATYSNLDFHVWKGNPYLTETLGQYKFRVSPTSFFQTNTLQAKVLYDVVKDFVGERVPLLYDLYCGAGSIGIYLAEFAEKIVGIEYVEDAVEDAKVNLELNGLSHFHFYAGDMKAILNPGLVSREGEPDIIVTDPPRAGMDEAVVRRLLQIGAPKIVYVSCNAATQARDLSLLEPIYNVLCIQPVDMFPQTSHVENVALLERK